MSSLLDQAIVDAKALKEAALKNAENLVIEKYSQEIKKTMDNLLEQEDPMAAMAGEDPMAADPMAGGMDMGMDMGGGMDPATEAEGEIDAVVDQLPDAFMSGLSQREGGLEGEPEETIRIDLDALTLELGGEEEELEEPMDMDMGMDMDMDMGMGMSAEPAPTAAAPAAAPAAPAPAAAAPAGPALQEDIELDIDDLLEALKIDFKPVKSGWAGTPDSVLEEYDDMILARENDDEVKEERKAVRARVAELQKENKILGSAAYKLQKENNKYRDAVIALQEKLESVNVSNAKLLYINQSLENASLNERQKRKIVEAISKTGSVSEAKVVYETLQDTVDSTHTKGESIGTLNEAVTRKSSLLMAVGRQQEKIADSSPFFERMQQLAGIDK
jgi:hypothetical protein